jgi:hypothetical protein
LPSPLSRRELQFQAENIRHNVLSFDRVRIGAGATLFELPKGQGIWGSREGGRVARSARSAAANDSADRQINDG